MRVKHDQLIDEAFDLVNDEPSRAIEIARLVVDAPDATVDQRVRAQWARGMARRERGELAIGADDLFAARQTAAAIEDHALAARIDTSLALVALFTGSVEGALEILAQAEPHLRGDDLARLETQRGLVHHRSGALGDAEREYRAARRHFGRSNDLVGRSRLLLNLGILHAERGDLARSVARLEDAAALATTAGQRLMAAGARHNLGYARSRAGKLTDALDDLQIAEATYGELGRQDYASMAQADRAELLMRCNLVGEARVAADLALQGIRRFGNDTDFADMALLAARCRLAAGRFDEARQAAQESATALHRQMRSASLALAELTQAEIEAIDHPDAAAGEALWEVSGRLDRYGWTGEATAARVRAGQLMLIAGEVERAAVILGGLRVVANRPAGERAAAYLAKGLLDEARGDRPRARAATRRGLRVVAENQTALGGFEFRTFAAGHGEALVQLGARMAIADGRPRELLDRLEATRRMLWLLPRPTPPSDEVLAGLLAELRVANEDLRGAIGSGGEQGELRQRRVELERQVRDHTRRGRAAGEAMTVTVSDAIAVLGDHALVEYAVVGDELHAVSVMGGRAKLHELGPVKGLADDIDSCTFALHRLNRAQGSAASRATARALLGELGQELAARLVPDRVRRSDRPLVVVPTEFLHGLAWGALAGLSGRPVSVSPSLIGWAVAGRAAARSARGRGVLLAAGPGLPGAPAEVETIATQYRRPTLLVGADATADATLAAMGHSRLVHLACHGSFRADNPLFSTLSLADGPLTVYDLERCRTMPRTVVLSACSVATASVLRGGTLLGLASALMTFGASVVIAPLTPVSDERVVDVMVGLHWAMATGAAPAAALASAIVGGDGLDPTAAAFVAIGA